jgi:nuclease S1
VNRRTKNRATALAAALFSAAAAVLPAEVLAFGALGHRTAVLLAERKLCAAARDEIADLDDGQPLTELALWADRVRDDPAWERAVPWHYINFPELPPRAGLKQARAAIDAFQHPPEGDVLTAITHFTATLADRSRPHDERAEALRFVVHFVVDVHQPLHVSRASDGGGTEVEVRVGEDVRSLHGFWDTSVFNRRGVRPEQFAEELDAAFEAVPDARAHEPPAQWAAESLVLRPTVYSFAMPAEGPAPLDDAYRSMAQRIAEERLVLAAARLSATLNGALCGATSR